MEEGLGLGVPAAAGCGTDGVEAKRPRREAGRTVLGDLELRDPLLPWDPLTHSRASRGMGQAVVCPGHHRRTGGGGPG